MRKSVIVGLGLILVLGTKLTTLASITTVRFPSISLRWTGS